MFNNDITYERASQLLKYDPVTGWFTRTGRPPKTKERQKRIRCTLEGKRAGSKQRNGYRYISIDYAKIAEHHLAFLFMAGQMPICQVDHINRIKDDNRWENLRLAPRNHVDNAQNLGINPRNKSGITGVSWNAKHRQWYVFIKCEGVNYYLGHFLDFFEAVCVRKAAELRYFTFTNS